MQITHEEISIREIVSGYADNGEYGVTALNGKLDIRPKYQREFVYKPKQREAVIQTIRRGFPLNIMYWSVNENTSNTDEVHEFEVLDGQQRTISFCQYVTGDFSVEVDGYRKAFHNLTKDQQEQILDYKLSIYKCKGTESEKLQWFTTINIAGEKLTDQELRNAVYSGSWLSAAKPIFSRPKKAAHLLASKYVSGDPNRQQLLETAIDWKSQKHIEQYMSDHQHDTDAEELWIYFKDVINWAKSTFPKVRKELKNVDWGFLFDKFKDVNLDPEVLEKEIYKLMMDDDVSNKSGIYSYVLTKDEKFLQIRLFSNGMKRAAYERQKGHCAFGHSSCKYGSDHVFALEEMEADHIAPWSLGGKTSMDNCQMLCVDCNRRKGSR